MLKILLVFCTALAVPVAAIAAYATDPRCSDLLAGPFEGPNQPPQVKENPLLRASQLHLGAIEFNRITIDQFRPAFDRAFRLAKARIDAIRNDSSPPTFQNTIEALEYAGEPLDKVQNIYFSFLGMKTNRELETMSDEINPRMVRYANSITFDARIFAKVDKLYQQRETLALTPEQATLLKNTWLLFVRNGAKLSREDKARVTEIDEALSLLTEKFKQNLNAATNSWELLVSDDSMTAGLPESARTAAADRAKKKGKEGWLFTLQAPSYMPVLRYAKSEVLREQVWRALRMRASSGANDNRPVLIEIAKLRYTRARILGYKSHADYTTADRMAGNAATVQNFLSKLADAYRPAALRDLEELKTFAGRELAPWDIQFYSEKLREDRYGYNEEELRPYFSLDNVIRGAFHAASRLYGVTFEPRNDLPVWDENVRAFEVKDRSGKTISLFYLDPFPRESKRPGAWMNTLRDGGIFAGSPRAPHVVNVENVTPPVGDTPALLSFSEVTTVFHELGHGLHAILTEAHYRSLSGTSVAWDFVELPSQFNENWAIEPEILDVYARHYQTGERIPAVLVDKVRRAQNFQAGWNGLSQIQGGMLDLAWYARDPSENGGPEDLAAWEAKTLAPYRVIDEAIGSRSTSFAHIFSGGYSGGYYSYKWADVLAADAFSVFTREGLFNPEVSERFRREILSKGGTEDAAVLYRRFRGSDPDPAALLRKEGLAP